MTDGERYQAKRDTDWRSALLDLCDGKRHVLPLFPKKTVATGHKVTSTGSVDSILSQFHPFSRAPLGSDSQKVGERERARRRRRRDASQVSTCNEQNRPP